jgi:phosphate transport system permease protein
VSSAETTFSGLKVRERLEAARARIRTIERVDRVAGVLIRLGGIGIVVSVLGILVFILSEAWPLFRPADGRLLGTVALPQAPPSPAVASPGRTSGSDALPAATSAPRAATLSPPAATLSPPSAIPSPPTAVPVPHVVQALGTDEYQMYLYAVRGQPRIEFFRLPAGNWASDFPVRALSGAVVTAASRSLHGGFVALGTADGRVALARVGFRPRYEGQKLADLDIDVEERGVATVDAAGRPVRQVDYGEADSGRKVVAALVDDDEIALWTAEQEVGSAVEPQAAAGSSGERTAVQALRTLGGERITRIALGRAEQLVAGTDRGNVYHWSVSGDPRLTSVSPVSRSPVSALGFALGETTFLAGTDNGELSAWFAARIDDEDAEGRIVRAHQFSPQGSDVPVMGASTRDKSFVAVGDDGKVTLRHLTSERTLLTLSGGEGAVAVAITPKGDGILLARRDGSLARYAVVNPHPEISWRTLFGKVWYEGYGRPAYVWQSTGATNDFETKFSLVPLVFGTLKGTLYALLFAIPLAVLSALYTSQFVHPDIRGRIKPTVEIMAALPSVVIGFVAGLYLAPLVERYVVAVLLMMVVLPVAGTAGVLLWGRLPRKAMRRLKPGMELALILPLLLLGAWITVRVAPAVEAALFRGDFRMWLSSALGLTYDQRNSLVVGLAMGFAVIPIIFTIADDAFSSVPSSLTAGSLALGASRWQTALRIVVPTASPGVFSAVMVGFGRAVGETMIVLMATGNTPVLDWSIFNGMRTLSANVAVEIPEAPYGGTLYRVLFLAAALLFTMTFVVNTVAEVIRQRLREKYRAL